MYGRGYKRHVTMPAAPGASRQDFLGQHILADRMWTSLSIHWSSFTMHHTFVDLMTSRLVLERKARPALLSVNKGGTLGGFWPGAQGAEECSLKGREPKTQEVKETGHVVHTPSLSKEQLAKLSGCHL